VTDANREQKTYWNEQAGPIWVSQQEQLDRQIGPHGERAIARLAPAPGERVLDLGCGCGASSLELARRVAPGGRVLGLDLSEPMLARAHERARAAGLANLDFRSADVQSASLEAGAFDAAFSRFGVMFFADPVAAFRNVLGALRAGGRLVFACWRPVKENAWVLVPMAAAAPLLTLPPPPPEGAPGPFAFGDAARVRSILEAAGFQAIAIEPVDLIMTPGGGDPEEAADTILNVGPLASALREMNAGASLRDQVRAAVRNAFEPHRRDGRVELGSAIWLVEARRAL
jgi:SAM-dependent methyltransferase